ncbi:PilZ domain-containing protein [Methylobacterium durans]|nr:PilZ domain-containing protein [Methylobacterium durans]
MAADSNAMVEQRRAPRQDLFRLGELHPAGGSSPIDCLVREASADGALIEVGQTSALPDAFTLKIQSTGLNKPCQVVRRTERCLGVAFTTA